MATSGSITLSSSALSSRTFSVPRPGTRAAPLFSIAFARGRESSSAMTTILRISGSSGSMRATRSRFSASARTASSSCRVTPSTSAISFCSILGLRVSSLRARTSRLGLPALSFCSSFSAARRLRSRRAALLALSNSSSSIFAYSGSSSASVGSSCSAPDSSGSCVSAISSA